ncbi:hypothetical protein Psta_3714 [Pirellula staleyi DSM 6068]|uniref:Uncharacterized protein n=1 Tax=Pirellula staleyi (strain ATCC 27377 / DSM 6068 / ICPB 4128) TaxID=530564 RepID=D2R004_PIRSD|nr:hypothetical protein Psta_3714 [Pirellula staleyi DSM 6068]
MARKMVQPTLLGNFVILDVYPPSIVIFELFYLQFFFVFC